MELKKLLEGVEFKKIVGESQREIAGVAYHTQKVEKGFLFAALRGAEVDGRRFVDEALERGAQAILLEEEGSVAEQEPAAAPAKWDQGERLLRSGPGTMIFVPNSRQALARVSSNFYGHPSSRVKLVGVTGTNGKTTTTYLLESILKKAGHPVGVIGTINYRYNQKVLQAPNTTPESLDLQRILGEMVREGVSHVIMEVSSHGLDLDRVFGCDFDGAVFTNFTQDHLDYHRTLDHYFTSKKRLFSELLMGSSKPVRFAVTNGDDPRGERIVDQTPLPVIRYGLSSPAQVSADQVDFTFEGISCRIRTPKGDFPIHSRLIGGFNLYNILAAVATGIGLDLPLEAIRNGVEALEGVSGRFERIENQRGIHVIVDYAHTPDALERVLGGIRSVHAEIRRSGKTSSSSPEAGKIITVFGCGGDRDRTKRPLMAEVVGTQSDLAILTSDNPRTEDPLSIMEEAERGFHAIHLDEVRQGETESWRSRKGYLKIADRREAIRTAIRLARPPDTVLIAGKGHEDYQIIGKKRFPFDDRLEAKKALEG